MKMKLELVVVPVTDIDRAKAYYVEGLGFIEDVDVRPAEGVRVVQLTPPGSACSIGLGTGLPAYEDMAPGTIRSVHLVVDDIEAARAEMLSRGVEVGDILDVGGGVKYASLTDPDGNTLTLQEMAWRTGEAFQAGQRRIDRADLQRIRLHDLRHTHETLLLQAAVDAKIDSERLGHHSVAFTLDTYARVIPGMQAAAVRQLADLIAAAAHPDHRSGDRHDGTREIGVSIWASPANAQKSENPR